MRVLLTGIAYFALTCGAAAADTPFQTLLTPNDLDPDGFLQWVDGKTQPVVVKNPSGPVHVFWTRENTSAFDGAQFGDSKNAGVRHLCAGFKTPVAVGSVLTRGGVQLSVLKESAPYPPNLSDETQWISAQRVKNGAVSSAEPGREEYVIWVLPSAIKTRALRFTHTAAPTDKTYNGWLGGTYVLSERMVNMAPQALASAGVRAEIAARINNENSDGWDTWDNGVEGAARAVSAEHAEWVMLAWPVPVKLCGLNSLSAGFSTADAQAYDGPPERHPRDALDSGWRTIKSFEHLENWYPLALGCNWMDFGQIVTTRAIRLRLTSPTTEGHPHLQGKTKNGKRVWLGELMALQPLQAADLKAAILAVPVVEAPHPPIAVRFKLAEPGFVTLVIDDAEGKRARNLVSETFYPAGENTAWWDGSDDIQRDREAAKHGIYHIPTRFVQLGEYRVRGLARKALDLRFEFSIYNGGNPAWTTEDRTGGWLTNHTPPHSALYVPGEKLPGGKPLVYLGSYVAEGGDGLAWVDLDGKKQGGRGWVGGIWTGAPYLACDFGPEAAADVPVYVGAAWEGELRLTGLTKNGDKTIAKYSFPINVDESTLKDLPPKEKERRLQTIRKEASALSGLAARNGVLVCSLPRQKQLLFVDAKAGKVLGSAEVADPRGLAFDAQGRLLALSGKQLLRYELTDAKAAKLPAPLAVVSAGLEDPAHVTMDSAGNYYVSDRGSSHQVKVFAPDGKLLRAIGAPGAPKAGPYDPNHMNNPNGLSIDSNNHLWVAETDFQPKRVSVWTLDGKLLKAFYGPSEYGGGGTLDPRDKTRFYYHGMEFKLDWAKGTDQLVNVIFREYSGGLLPPANFGGTSTPDAPLYANGRRYFTNCYNCNPTNGAPIACLWLERDGIAIPVAALGRANDWNLLKGDDFKPSWPAGADLKGDYWNNAVMFVWSDANGDRQAQVNEVAFLKGQLGGVTVMPDLSYVVSRTNGKAMRFAPKSFTPEGVPFYDLAAGEVLAEGVQGPASSGGDQALVSPDGWSIMTLGAKPFAPESLGGAYKGVVRWAYPSLWPGLHASHESPVADYPGELLGTTRLLGGFINPRNSDAGPIWAVNSNQGSIYLLTADGLFVATLFKDNRQGLGWAMPVAQRGMLLNALSLGGENFWPGITQTEDGNVYVVDGARTSLVKVEGLETIKRLPDSALTVGADELKQAQAYFVESEVRRQSTQGTGTLKAAMRQEPLVVDGKLDDWAGAEWVDVDKSGVAAYFDSNTRPHNVTAAVAVANDRLYAAFRTDDKDLLRNTGELPNAPFKTGGALDLMIGANSQASEKRSDPVEGDLRLLITLVKGKPLAVLYRAVVPGTKEPVPFSSPWRTIHIDRVEDVSAQVQFAQALGDYEISIPLSVLNLKPQPGQVLKGDIGILRGNGIETVQRVYWSNKATGLTSDVPGEAMLTPQLWGKWSFAPVQRHEKDLK